MPLRFRIQVGAKPDEVFAYVSDFTRHGEWANPKAGLVVESVSGGATAVGSKFRSSQSFLGKKTGADITVTAFEPARRLAFEAVQAGKKGEERYTNTLTFTPSRDGTLVERAIERQPPSMLLSVLYPVIRADAMTALRRLKTRFQGPG